MHTGSKGVWGRTPRGRLWWTHPCDPVQRPQRGAYRTFWDHGAGVALGTEWTVTGGLRKRGLKCLSLGKIQKRMEGGAQDTQVSRRCDEMSPRAPAQWAGGGCGRTARWDSHLIAPSFLSPLPLHLPLPHLPHPIRALYYQSSRFWDHPALVPHLTNRKTEAQGRVCLSTLVHASCLSGAGLSTSFWPSVIFVRHRLPGRSTFLRVPWRPLCLVTARWEDSFSQSQPWDEGALLTTPNCREDSFFFKERDFFFLIGTEDSQYPLKLFFFPVIIFQPWIIRISF